MFQLNTGSFEALESAATRALAQLRRRDSLSSTVILSPSGGVLSRLQMRLATALPGYLNLHFLTFYALADRMLAEVASPTDNIAREASLYSEIIRDLLLGQSDVQWLLREDFFKTDQALPKGLPGALAETLRDLRDSGARIVDSLKAALEGHLGSEADKTASALELYARVYEVLQKHHLRTPADQLRRATELAPSSTWLQKQQSIWIYGIYDLTGVQLDFMLSLAKHPNVQLYFPYEENKPAYAYAERLLNDPALVAKVGSKVKLPEPVGMPPAQEIWSCSGAQDEVWLAAKQVLALHAKGFEYSKILLCARTLGPYASIIREVFENHHIPYSMSHEESVGAYPLIKSARQLLVLERDDYPADALLDLFASPYFQPQGAANDSELWSRLIKEAGIVTGWNSWEARLGHWAEKPAPTDFPEARAAASTLLHVLRRLRQDLTGQGTAAWSDHVLSTVTLLSQWLRLPREIMAEESAIWKALLNAVQTLTALDALDKPVSRRHFMEILEEKLDALMVSLAPSNNAGVPVMDVMTSRGLSFDAVIVMGMTEKSFPRLIREDPFLSDRARSALSSALGCRLARKLDGYQEERLLFQLIKRSARQSLIFTYQRSDDEGKALVPSLYLQDLDIPKTGHHHLDRSLNEKWAQVPLEDLTPREVSVSLNKAAVDPAPFYGLLDYDKLRYASLRKSQDALESLRAPLGDRDGATGPLASWPDIRQKGFSADSLKLLAQCPFNYFSSKILKLSPGENTSRQGVVAADASGKLIHLILETFYRRILREKVTMDWMTWGTLLDEACDRCFQSFQDSSVDFYPLAWQATQISIRQKLHRFLKKDIEELRESGFKPTYFEQEIAGYMPELTPPLNAMPFHGRIDRIDLREEAGERAFRVIDYKTGRTSAKGKTHTKILRGEIFQLPVYLSLAKQWLTAMGGREAIPLSAQFYNLADRESAVESPSITPDFWESCGASFSDNISGLITLVEKGIFYIRPNGDNQGYCSWCDYSQICRKEHKPSALRSEYSEARQANDQRLKRTAP